MPPGYVWLVLFGVKVTERTAFSVTASWIVSCAPDEAETARKNRSEVPAAAPAPVAGVVTTAQTSRLLPEAMIGVGVVTVAPVVEQLPTPPSALNTTVQPVGRVTLLKLLTVLAPRT